MIKFLLDAATSFTSITSVLLSIVIMICFYIYINRKIHKLEHKVDNVLGQTIHMVQEVIDESKQLKSQYYFGGQQNIPSSKDTETDKDESKNINNVYAGEYQHDDEVRDVEDEEEDSDDDSYYNEEDSDDDDDNNNDEDDSLTEIQDMNESLKEPIEVESDENTPSIDIKQVYDIKSIHMEDNEIQEKELKKYTVAELREKAIQLDLKTAEELKKMKKNDIIKLLEQ